MYVRKLPHPKRPICLEEPRAPDRGMYQEKSSRSGIHFSGNPEFFGHLFLILNI